MRELNTEELHSIQGGFVITATLITLIASGVVATIYLSNTLINLYMFNKSGTMPTQPPAQDTNEIGNEIKDIANVINAIHH